MTDLQEAFREAARREFAMVPDETELEYTFSPGFQRKMQRIIRAQVHGYWNMVNTMGKRIAIAAVIIAMLLTTAMAIKPIRDRVIKFFVEVYEEYFEIRFGKEEKGDIGSVHYPMERYTLESIPQEYVLIQNIESDTLLWTHWRNEQGNSISLQQEPGIQKTTIDYLDGNLKTITFNGWTIYHQNNIDSNCFLWEYDGYVFCLTTYTEFETDEALEIISSLKKVSNT